MLGRGREIIRWMDDPNAPDCPVRGRHTVTFEQLRDIDPTVFIRQNSIEADGSELVTDFEGIEPEQTPDLENLVSWEISFTRDTYRALGLPNSGVGDLWRGITAPGMIAIESIRRSTPDFFPPVSNIAIALYNRAHGDINSLRYVFFDTVVNSQTRMALTRTQVDSSLPRVLNYGEESFEMIMGTRLARTTAYIVLSAFPRGTRRISRIFVYRVQEDYINLRFDIGDIPPGSA